MISGISMLELDLMQFVLSNLGVAVGVVVGQGLSRALFPVLSSLGI